MEVTWIGDLESDGLKYECTKIHCIVNYCTDTHEWHISVPGRWIDRVSKFITTNFNDDDMVQLYPNHMRHLMVMEEVHLVYHNGINFDFPAIEKLNNWWSRPDKIDDTFILSSLFQPDRVTPKGCKGPHSIDAYGTRFKVKKPEYEQWAVFDLEMLHRCIEDVKIGVKTYELLQKERSEWDWEKAIRLEYAVARYHAQQELNGCPFDKELAVKTLGLIQEELTQLDKYLLNIIPRTCKSPYTVPINKPFLMSGLHSANTIKWFNNVVPNIGGPFTRVQFIPINLNSDAQVKKYLLTQGWVPREWNYKKDKNGRWMYDSKGKKIKSSPKLTEESYPSIKSDIGKELARRAVLRHRENLIQNRKDPNNKGLLSFIRSDGRIPAEGVPQAAITGRYRHRKIR